MFLSSINAAILFLINTLFDLYILVLMLRFILTLVGVNYLNPFSQTIIKLTQPVVIPLKQLKIANIKRVETATLLLILAFEIIKYILAGFISGASFHILGIIILSIVNTLKLFIDVFFYAILIQVILSWLKSSYSPIIQILFQITQPILRIFHRLIPPVNGIDLSPIAALISLQLIIIILIKPLSFFAMGLTFG